MRSESPAKAARRILIATSRFNRGSRARYTSPIPPRPSNSVISKWPSVVPLSSDGTPGESSRNDSTPDEWARRDCTSARMLGSGQAWARNWVRSSGGCSWTALNISSTLFQVSASIRGSLAAQLAFEPDFSHAPVALNSVWVHVKNFRRFLRSQASEVSEFHDTGLAGVEFRQLSQCIIECDQCCGLTLRPGQSLGQGQQLSAIAALSPATSPCMVDQDVAHQL